LQAGLQPQSTAAGSAAPIFPVYYFVKSIVKKAFRFLTAHSHLSTFILFGIVSETVAAIIGASIFRK
jgi:hypothetical protein